MKQENCCCGASIKLTYDVDGVYDEAVIDLFNRLHSGPSHDQRVTAGEGNRIRHFYGARRDRKAAAARARRVMEHDEPPHEWEPTWCARCEELERQSGIKPMECEFGAP